MSRGIHAPFLSLKVFTQCLSSLFGCTSMRLGTSSVLFPAVKPVPGKQKMLNASLMNGWMKDRAVLLGLYYAHESTRSCMKLQSQGITFKCWNSALITSSRWCWRCWSTGYTWATWPQRIYLLEGLENVTAFMPNKHGYIGNKMQTSHEFLK